RAIDKLRRVLDHLRHWRFATQMQVVLNAQQTCRARLRDRPPQFAALPAAILTPSPRPNPSRVNPGRIPARAVLAPRGDDSRDGVPVYSWARRAVGFDMVGMQFHQARQQKITAKVSATFGAAAFANFLDQAIFDTHIAALD